MDNPILGGRHSGGEVVFVLKLDHIRDDLAFDVSIDQLEALVGVKGRANVVTLLCMEISRMLSGQLCILSG
jgi:hypothetical protein